jgi:hypothetical protein
MEHIGRRSPPTRFSTPAAFSVFARLGYVVVFSRAKPPYRSIGFHPGTASLKQLITHATAFERLVRPVVDFIPEPHVSAAGKGLEDPIRRRGKFAGKAGFEVERYVSSPPDVAVKRLLVSTLNVGGMWCGVGDVLPL